ncbi:MULTISPECIES: DUF389 domain-containing protein [unclassified Modestobacter]
MTLPPDLVETVVQELRSMEPLSLKVFRGASLQPPGDVVTVEVTNRRLAEVVRLADRCGAGRDSSVSLSTSRPASTVSAGRHDDVMQDITSGTAEEIELEIGRESTMTAGKIGVMVTAGLIAGFGLASGSLHLVIGAMVIAPGFEPFSRIALGLVERSAAWRRGLLAVAKGYAALAAGAALSALAMVIFGADALSAGTDSYLSSAALVSYFSTTSWVSWAVAVVGGFGGALLLVINRRVLTAGVMIALGLIPSLSLAAMAVVAGDGELALRSLGRWAVDATVVTAMSAGVFTWHRRHDGRAATS